MFIKERGEGRTAHLNVQFFVTSYELIFTLFMNTSKIYENVILSINFVYCKLYSAPFYVYSIIFQYFK